MCNRSTIVVHPVDPIRSLEFLQTNRSIELHFLKIVQVTGQSTDLEIYSTISTCNYALTTTFTFSLTLALHFFFKNSQGLSGGVIKEEIPRFLRSKIVQYHLPYFNLRYPLLSIIFFVGFLTSSPSLTFSTFLQILPKMPIKRVAMKSKTSGPGESSNSSRDLPSFLLLIIETNGATLSKSSFSL